MVVGVGQSSGREVVRQRSCALEGSGVEVVEVGRGDQVDGVERLLEAVGGTEMVQVRQSPSLVEGGGSAGRAGLFESK